MNSAASPKQPLVTACLRSYGRPLRTRRMLECIFAQNFTNFEVLFMADGCPHFNAIVQQDWFKEAEQQFKIRGNRIYSFNAAAPGKDWGAKVTNTAIKMATGKYFIFLDNDDKILPEHVQYYYNSIAMYERGGAPVDFVYNKMMIFNGGHQWVMEPELKSGSVGHGSLIVCTEFLKTMPPHQPVYGQDWLLIQDMMKAGCGEKGNILFPTYYVMSNRNQPEPGMENDKGFDDEIKHMPITNIGPPLISYYISQK